MNTANTPIVHMADVLIQAGHEGRTSGATGARAAWGSEQEWNPIVADEATRLLREASISVIRAPAALEGTYEVGIAIYIHFDGSAPPGRSGASIGYGRDAHAAAAEEWKRLYSQHWPFRWMPDNFTENLRQYYGFRRTVAYDAALVLELGDISGQEQGEWLKPRRRWLGYLIAYFAARRIGRGCIAEPAAWVG